MLADATTVKSMKVSVARGANDVIEIRDHAGSVVGGATIGSEIAGVLSYLNALIIGHMDTFGVHSGVVGGPDGAIAFPGRSGEGKTTLTAACLRLGYDYVSDEVLAFPWQPKGYEVTSIKPYPRPLAVSPWSAGVLGLPTSQTSAGEIYTSATDLGAKVATRPIAVRHMVLLGPITGTTRLTPMTRQRAAANLLQRSFNGWQHPSQAFARAHSIAAHTSCWLLERGDPIECAGLLKDRLSPDCN